MDDKVKINFYGTPDKLNAFKRHQEELKSSYITSFEEAETQSNMDGEEKEDESYLAVRVEVKSDVLGFLGGFVLREAGKYLLKTAVFKPLTDWLEKVDNCEENTADVLIFEYEDIIVKIAYAKRNHQNVVGRLTIELVKHVPHLRRLQVGTLNMVATPVDYFNPQWKFYMPSERFSLDKYVTNWGLEYNASNRCVLRLPQREITYEHWWE